MSKRAWLGIFAAGFVAGGVLGTGIIVNAAVGDLIYEVPAERVEITGAQAANIADCYIAEGSWSGTRANMISCTAERDEASATGFVTVCAGTKTAAPASLPIGDGVRVVGVVE